MTKILAGIVIYNPDLDKLHQNLSAIFPQVDRMIVVDNGSLNFNQAKSLLPPETIVVHNERNLGIATALNQILQYALDYDFDWALTLDQDSVVADNMISVYRKVAASNQHLGVICCRYRDRNFAAPDDRLTRNCYVYSCITSASLVNVKAWQEIGGFDDYMFIDSVDHDFNHRLWKAGWGVFKTIDTELLHELGKSLKTMSFFGHKYKIYNHSSLRYYYISRNGVYETRKNASFVMALYGALHHFFLIFLVWRFEPHKVAKTIKIIQGTVAGLTCSITKHVPRDKQPLNILNGGGKYLINPMPFIRLLAIYEERKIAA